MTGVQTCALPICFPVTIGFDCWCYCVRRSDCDSRSICRSSSWSLSTGLSGGVSRGYCIGRSVSWSLGRGLSTTLSRGYSIC